MLSHFIHFIFRDSLNLTHLSILWYVLPNLLGTPHRPRHRWVDQFEAWTVIRKLDVDLFIHLAHIACEFCLHQYRQHHDFVWISQHLPSKKKPTQVFLSLLHCHCHCRFRNTRWYTGIHRALMWGLQVSHASFILSATKGYQRHEDWRRGMTLLHTLLIFVAHEDGRKNMENMAETSHFSSLTLPDLTVDYTFRCMRGTQGDHHESHLWPCWVWWRHPKSSALDLGWLRMIWSRMIKEYHTVNAVNQ